MPNAVTNSTRLPYEVWIYIGQKLSSTGLLRLGQTCRILNLLSHDHTLWNSLFAKCYPGHAPQPGVPFRQQFREVRQVYYNLRYGFRAVCMPSDPKTVQASYGIFLFEGLPDGTVKKYVRDENGDYQLRAKRRCYEKSVDALFFNHGYLFVKYSDGKMAIFSEEMNNPPQLLFPPVNQPWHVKIIDFDGETLLLDLNGLYQAWSLNSKGQFEPRQTFRHGFLNHAEGCNRLFFIGTQTLHFLKKREGGVYRVCQTPMTIFGLSKIKLVGDYLFLFTYQNIDINVLKKNAKTDNYEEIQVLQSSEQIIYYNVKNKDLLVFSADKSLQIYKEEDNGTFTAYQNLGTQQTIIYFEEQSDYFITQFKDEKIHIWKKQTDGRYEECSLETKRRKYNPLVHLEGEDGKLPLDYPDVVNTLSMIGPFLISSKFESSIACTGVYGCSVNVWENDMETRTFKPRPGFYVAVGSCVNMWHRNNLLLNGHTSDTFTNRDCRVINMAASPLVVLRNIAYRLSEPEIDFRQGEIKSIVEQYLRLPNDILKKIPEATKELSQVAKTILEAEGATFYNEADNFYQQEAFQAKKVGKIILEFVANQF